MAATVVQANVATNGLAQTFNNTYTGGPVEGNLLVACIWHDESTPGSDIATLTSSGWTRMFTHAAMLGSFSYRMSVFAKFAGAGESTTVAWNLGEVNRRTHGYAVEFSGTGVVELPAADAADFVFHDGTTAGTSNQVDNSIEIPDGVLGFTLIGLSQNSTVRPSWASEVTKILDSATNFKGSAIGYTDPVVTIQPTATWGTSRTNEQATALIGVPPPIPPSTKLLARSSFQVWPAATP